MENAVNGVILLFKQKSTAPRTHFRGATSAYTGRTQNNTPDPINGIVKRRTRTIIRFEVYSTWVFFDTPNGHSQCDRGGKSGRRATSVLGWTNFVHTAWLNAIVWTSSVRAVNNYYQTAYFTFYTLSVKLTTDVIIWSGMIILLLSTVTILFSV